MPSLKGFRILELVPGTSVPGFHMPPFGLFHRRSTPSNSLTIRLQFLLMHLRKTIIFLIALTLCASAVAQKKPARHKASTGELKWQLISMNVKGSERYTSDEILPATGLQIGQFVNEDDFKKATEQLGQTGLFSDASYAFTYSSDGAKLEFQLTDNNQLEPAQFDNFVWLSDKALVDKLHERIPLFKGLLPTEGDMADEVSDALQAILIEHKVQGKVDYVRAGSILFTVGAHSVRVNQVTFTNAAGEQSLLQDAARRLLNGDYTRTVIRNEERLGFLPIYLERGHLKASFDEAEVKVAHESEDETTVNVTIAVTPGLQYKLTDIAWMGNTVFPAPRLQSLMRLKAGEPTDAIQLDKDLQNVRNLYGTKGYMGVQITPKPVFDDPASTVHYDLIVNEGDIYKMGELEVRGLDEKSKARIVLDWKLDEGKIYDSSYFQRFMVESAKDLPTDAKWTVMPEVALNEDKTVDVTLRYQSK